MQMDRPIELLKPDGFKKDELLFHSMRGTEQLGRLFEYQLEILSESDVKFDKILGKKVTVRLATSQGDKERHFNGHVTRFAVVGSHGSYLRYQATLRPWFWFLTRTSDCRIFQKKSVPEIIEAIFGEHGFSDFKNELKGTYRTLEYSVQYRESVFSYLSRLMEKEGIYYYFEHTDSGHSLVLADGLNSHTTVNGYEKIPYFPYDDGAARERDHIYDWYLTQEIQPSIFASDDHDFERPNAGLEVQSSVTRSHENADFEIYDYPGEYCQAVPAGDGPYGDAVSDGQSIADVRIQEREAQFERAHGRGDVSGLNAGVIFELTDCYRGDQDRKYIVESITHELMGNEYESSGGDGGPTYRCSFTAIDSSVQFRSERLTAIPTVHGVQTAVVVGPSGEDIWTDKYGRVKVQFHWDREGQADENSSCWVRVSSNWAGNNWGGMFLPHVGHEVIVDFLEGDPDKPIIVGRTYNNDNMPPQPLPGNKDKSIIQDVFGQQMCFDATPGEESLRLHTPANSTTLCMGGDRGFEFKSTDDEWKFIHGTTKTCRIGTKHIIQVGTKWNLFGGMQVGFGVGFKLDVFFGASCSVYWGPKCTFERSGNVTISRTYKYTSTNSREITANKADYIRASTSDIVHDSDGNYMAVGGDKDNSIVKLTKEKLTIAFGEGDPGVNVADADEHSIVQGTIAGAVASVGAAAAVIAAGSVTAKNNKAPDDPCDPRGDQEVEWPDFWESAGLAGGLIALAAGGKKAHSLGKKALKPIGDKKAAHTTKHSELLLNEKGALLSSGESHIKILKDGDVTIRSVGDIKFKKCGEIKFADFAKLDDGTFKFLKTKKLKMESFEVTG